MKVFQESDIIELLDGYLPGEWVVNSDDTLQVKVSMQGRVIGFDSTSTFVKLLDETFEIMVVRTTDA